MNCLIDLHLHLDGSLSLDTVKELAEMQDIPLCDDEELTRKLKVSPDCRDLNEYLEKFDFPLSLLQTGEALEYSVRSLLNELSQKGYIYAEIRFAPQLHTQKAMTQKDAVIAAIKGLSSSDLPANLILCTMRSDNNFNENKETIDIASEFLNKGVCAADLAGAEGLYPTDNFRYVFEYARRKGVPFTIHAGEAGGAGSVYSAIDMGAERIGHGVRSYEDKSLVKKLAGLKIPLELCPTSNLNTGVFKDIHDYPIMEYIKNGVIVTINSDNMTVSDTDVKKELELIEKAFSFGKDDIKKLLLNSARSAFADENTKAMLTEKINNDFKM